MTDVDFESMDLDALTAHYGRGYVEDKIKGHLRSLAKAKQRAKTPEVQAKAAVYREKKRTQNELFKEWLASPEGQEFQRQRQAAAA